MRVRGIDPGDRIGWCDIEARAGALPTRIASGAVAQAEDLPPLTGIDVVAVEMPLTLHPAAFATGGKGRGGPARIVATVQGLIRAARVGQRVLDDVDHTNVTLDDLTRRTIEVDAAAARRALGVVIGGSRKGPPCEACAGSGAGGPVLPGVALAPEVAAEEIARCRAAAVRIREMNARHAKGKKGRVTELAAIRLRAVQAFPCEICHGAGDRRPPAVDQQVATLLPGAVDGWPDRSNVHERDAAVVALWAIRNGGLNG